MTNDKTFYVYVYIDPRNFQEFYYGKGKGDRKTEHLHDENDSEKTRIIRDIKSEGLEPIIKVIARNLSEDQALLVEKTLIWKLGRTLTNKSSGHFADNFRPHHSLHKDLYGFDYENGVYCINIGEGEHRSWEDSYKYGFISAGQDWEKWGSRICSLRRNDILCAYLSRFGYVGIAKVLEEACPATQFRYKGKPLSYYPLKSPKMLEVKGDLKDAEFTMRVEWIAVRDKKDRIGGDLRAWRSRSMLGSMESQQETLALLERKFGVSFDDLLLKKESQAA